MKLIHQRLQKVNMMLRHLLINVALLSLCAYSKAPASDLSGTGILVPDSVTAIYVFSMDMDVYTPTNISKEYFLIHSVQDEHMHRIIIKNSDMIAELITVLTSLPIAPDMVSVKGDTFSYLPIVSKSDQLFLINKYPLDIRCLIIIEHDGKFSPIWISSTLVDINGTYYLNSDLLREWLSRVENSQ